MATIWRHRRGDERAPPHPGYTRDFEGKEIETCTFCAQPYASGYWQAQGCLVSVCHTCAVKVLPALMADALVGEHGDEKHKPFKLQDDLKTAMATFWQAAAIAIHRSVDVRQREDSKLRAELLNGVK